MAIIELKTITILKFVIILFAYFYELYIYFPVYHFYN